MAQLMKPQYLQIFGEHDHKTIEQINKCLAADPQAIAGVLCADGHAGYTMSVGGVIASRDKVGIQSIGSDICCGNLAIKTDIKYNNIKDSMNTIMDDVIKNISFGIGRHNKQKVDHPLFDSESWSLPCFKGLKRQAEDQLGTVGSGNHYVDIFYDEEENVWVGVHFGSRGLGFKTAKYFLEQTRGKENAEYPTLVDVNTDLGREYLRAVDLCSEYAYAGREYVAYFVAKNILGGKILDEVHNNHNSYWVEEHFGEKVYVTRKGATPAFPGQRGFVGGSMGDDAVIIEGVDSSLSKLALYSTVHGAGRIMSRNQARGKINRKTGEIVSSGVISQEDMNNWLKYRGVVLRGGDLDEAPQAYRRLHEVLEYHKETIRILHTLKPVGVAMAGRGDFDPYKD